MQNSRYLEQRVVVEARPTTTSNTQPLWSNWGHRGICSKSYAKDRPGTVYQNNRIERLTLEEHVARVAAVHGDWTLTGSGSAKTP
jgi:hypothetical protein